MDPIQDAMRSVFRRYPSGVAVIAATDGLDVFAMTASSLVSASLAPPLVLFCAKRGGATGARIRAGAPFSVSLLTADQEPVARRFAGGPDAKSGAVWAETGVWRWVGAAAGVLLCQSRSAYEGGDHDILLGEVVSAFAPRAEASPAVYFDGRFERLVAVDPAGDPSRTP